MTTELERLVMHKNSEELIDKLALMLGIAGDESAEARWSDEVFKRKVLRGAIIALDAEWNPKCCEGAPRSVRDEIMRLRGEVARLSAHIAEIE